ncbi:MAG TPA: PhzF family phenazine biosynthesis protein [Burkholderiales bacterium]|nr:PhzF family phenazine biosynthesis protein [Burkholderiales bacterium]
MSSPLPFQQVDVFTSVPFKGNPVAVVLDGNSLSTQAMQAIAGWTNLSETTFVCTPTDARADYRLRIFTPRSELPFAGHPTIGSAHAVLRYGLKPKTAGRLIQECGKGLVTLALDDRRLFLSLPKPQLRDVPALQLDAMAAALGISASTVHAKAVIDVGVVWITLQLDSARAVTRLEPDLARIAAATPRGVAGVTVFGLTSAGGEVQLEVRSFAPAEGVPEDPVCGSGNGCVAALVKRDRLLAGPTYVASQGGCVGRDGRVEVRFADDDTIWLGGQAVTCVEGTLRV